MRVFVAPGRIAFRVPIDGQVPVRKRQRIFRHRLLHQAETFLELAFVNRHFAESVQRHGARKRIGRHVEDRFETRAGFVPGADVMPIVLGEIAQRSRVGGIHPVRLLIKFFRRDVMRIHLGDQAAAHRTDDQSALAQLEDWCGRNAGDVRDAEALQLLRRLFRFLRKQAFLFEHCLVHADGAVFVTGFCFTGGFFHLAVEGGFALLHLAVEQFFHRGNFELATLVLEFAHRRAIGIGEHRHRQL